MTCAWVRASVSVLWTGADEDLRLWALGRWQGLIRHPAPFARAAIELCASKRPEDVRHAAGDGSFSCVPRSTSGSYVQLAYLRQFAHIALAARATADLRQSISSSKHTRDAMDETAPPAVRTGKRVVGFASDETSPASVLRFGYSGDASPSVGGLRKALSQRDLKALEAMALPKLTIRTRSALKKSRSSIDLHRRTSSPQPVNQQQQQQQQQQRQSTSASPQQSQGSSGGRAEPVQIPLQ